MEFSDVFSFYRVFSSHMVLQREKPIVLSGKACPGKKVKLSFAGNERLATANPNGEWTAEFPAMQAGGPYSITLSGANDCAPLTLHDILIGEVWMCTGQSNMEMPVFSENPFWRTLNAQDELQKANHPQIRLYNSMLTRRMAPAGPLKDECGNGWQLCNAENIADFSACGYFFGRTLQKDLNVPIGLIAAAWGGTNIEAWISREKFAQKHWTPIIDQQDSRQLWKNLRETDGFKNLLSWLEKFDSFGQPDNSLLQPDADDCVWSENTAPVVNLPRPGRYICRVTIDVPQEFAGQNVVLETGVFNDTDKTYFNGEFIGSTGVDLPAYWSITRKYQVPGHCIHPGRNCVAIVIDNHFGTGSANMSNWKLTAGKRCKEIQPECRWTTVFTVPADFPRRPDVPNIGAGRSPDGPNYPSTLFNGMLYPWFRYTVRGIIWYQGCNNNGEFTYYPLHKMLIDDLREHWGEPDMPFLLVQLAAFDTHCPDQRRADSDFDNTPFPEFSPYALTREIQAELPLSRKNVGMIAAFDCGDHSDIHPRDKQTLGKRLAQKAEQMLFDPQKIADGPTFAGLRVEGSTLRVFFHHTGSGLTTSDGRAPIGFVLGDRTGTFYKAQAVIDGNSVVLTCPMVPEPQRVRYAFTGYCKVNLCNRQGYPALPFRSDKPDYAAMFPEII